MPEAQRLPRKFLSQLQQSQEDLRQLGQQIRSTISRLKTSRYVPETLEAALRDIESSAYRIALELAEMKVVDDCNGCPCAPSSLPSQVHLLVLADELERQALLARRRAQTVLLIDDESESRVACETRLLFQSAEYHRTKNNRLGGRLERMLDIYRTNPEASYEEIGRAIGRSKGTVANYVKELNEQQRIRVVDSSLGVPQ
jgi:hypothetical protein